MRLSRPRDSLQLSSSRRVEGPETAGAPAREIAERLLARVAAWRGDREQGDDVTCVVVRNLRGCSGVE